MAKNEDDILESSQQLLEYFTKSYKPESDWKVGPEYEKFVIGYPGLRPLEYEGKVGIRSLFKGLEDGYKWNPEYEDDNVIALLREGESVSLEPGGQVELSGKAFKTIHESYDEVQRHIQEVKDVSKNWDVAWFGCGMNPFLSTDEIPWMPKKRYNIMKNYLIKQGHLSHKMMKQTCTIQANIDYKSEEDAMKKLKVANGVNSIVTAMFANSAIYCGKETGFMTERSYIWQFTDPERCGIIEGVFSNSYSFQDYIDFAIDVHMFLIKRNGQMIDMTEMTFKEYMKKGYKGHKATTQDWDYHLSTVFPEVRLLKYIELRGQDSQPLDLYLAIPAIWKGLLYSEQALDAAWDLVKDLNYQERVTWHDDVSREAMQAKIKKYKTKELAKELFDISYESLKNMKNINRKGQNETIYLEALEEKVIKTGKSPAETVIEKWNTVYDRDLDKLLKHYII
ncbi:MAG: glutamate--cysteine ligase [Candidatus Sericytochromatia bacterium]|nr:glutamate--cysteine ligase [Candidatus Sericytochromatia bacterium]